MTMVTVWIIYQNLSNFSCCICDEKRLYMHWAIPYVNLSSFVIWFDKQIVIVGGTFALYSLICRYAKVGLLPSQEPEDRDISNYQLEMPSSRLRRASKVKSTLENSQTAKHFLLCITMLGTAMVIGDGIVTPSMSGMTKFYWWWLPMCFCTMIQKVPVY